MVTALKPCRRVACPGEIFQDTYTGPESYLLKEDTVSQTFLLRKGRVGALSSPRRAC